jgi:hypothetical protein
MKNPKKSRTNPPAGVVLVSVRLTRPATGSVLNLEVTSAELPFLAEQYPGWIIAE